MQARYGTQKRCSALFGHISLEPRSVNGSIDRTLSKIYKLGKVASRCCLPRVQLVQILRRSAPSRVWVKSLWEDLPNVDIDTGAMHVVSVGLPIRGFAVLRRLRKVFRECGFEYPWDPFEVELVGFG